MAEIYDNADPKIIAFYLPQFHTIPENDRWWGKGFTEWTNVRKAVPLFPGHNEPRRPLHGNYYDLTDNDVKRWQADLAKKYGVYGFCYYHYWFRGGKKLLEKPAEQMLADPSIDLPFCFSWANENWSRNWDGGNHEIMIRQEYGGEKEWEAHFQYLLPFFKDRRYITVKGKPLFIIYKPDIMPDVYAMTRYFRKRAKEEGFPDLCLAYQFPTYYNDMYYRDDIFDYLIEFEPVYSRYMTSPPEEKLHGNSEKVYALRKVFGEDVIAKYRKMHGGGTASASSSASKALAMYFYDETWEKILSQLWTPGLIPGAFTDWDNTPRNKHGITYAGTSPEAFEKYMKAMVRRLRKENRRMLFLNAWNEWGEGAYLEPDEKNGYGMLEGISRALSDGKNGDRTQSVKKDEGGHPSDQNKDSNGGERA
ncbi:MAG: glycoside hydrolase family 99-like domain-containing protein [Chordicoccus sp.]